MEYEYKLYHQIQIQFIVYYVIHIKYTQLHIMVRYV